jgi:hypothetical protein
MTTLSHQETPAIPTNTGITTDLSGDYNGNFGLSSRDDEVGVGAPVSSGARAMIIPSKTAASP